MNFKLYDYLIIGGALLALLIVVWDKINDMKAAKEEREHNASN